MFTIENFHCSLQTETISCNFWNFFNFLACVYSSKMSHSNKKSLITLKGRVYFIDRHPKTSKKAEISYDRTVFLLLLTWILHAVHARSPDRLRSFLVCHSSNCCCSCCCTGGSRIVLPYACNRFIYAKYSSFYTKMWFVFPLLYPFNTIFTQNLRQSTSQ